MQKRTGAKTGTGSFDDEDGDWRGESWGPDCIKPSCDEGTAGKSGK